MKVEKKKKFHKRSKKTSESAADFTSLTEGEGVKKRRRNKYSTFRPNEEIKKVIKVSETVISNREAGGKYTRAGSSAEDEKPVKEKRSINEFLPPLPVEPKKLERYSRGEGVDTKKIKHKFYQKRFQNKEKKINYAIEQAARTEYLLPEDSG
jgi:hypothetical protein